MSVKLAGAYFKQTKLIHPNNNNVINIYIVYKIEPIFRLSDYTVQNALFGGVKITKNATDTSKDAKDDQIVKEMLCLGNISDDWTTEKNRIMG